MMTRARRWTPSGGDLALAVQIDRDDLAGPNLRTTSDRRGHRGDSPLASPSRSTRASITCEADSDSATSFVLLILFRSSQPRLRRAARHRWFSLADSGDARANPRRRRKRVGLAFSRARVAGARPRAASG